MDTVGNEDSTGMGTTPLSWLLWFVKETHFEAMCTSWGGLRFEVDLVALHFNQSATKSQRATTEARVCYYRTQKRGSPKVLVDPSV